MRRILTLVLVAILTVGIVPAGAVAQDDSTPTQTPVPTTTETPTPTSTPTSGGGNSGESANTSGNSGGDANASGNSGLKSVDVYVEQPRFISQSVGESKDGGLNTYTVRGSVHELEPSAFNASAVVKSGVREDGATLKLDKGIDRWVLDAQGTSGTYRVFWVVRENGGTETYGANIKVAQASYQHVNPGEYEGLKNSAANWKWVVSQFEGAGLINHDASLEKTKSVIEDAVTWFKFYTDPLSALSGQFVTLGIMLVSWPAGWIILGVLLLLFFIRDRGKTRQNRRFKRQFARIEDVDEAERRAEERELKRILSMKNFTDLGLTESDAEAIREHCDAENPRQFLARIRDYLSEERMVALLLDCHEQLGHEIRVRRNDLGDVTEVSLQSERLVGEENVSTDGGTVAADADGDELTVSYIDPTEADDDLVLQLDWTELDPELLWDDRVNAGDLSMPIANDGETDDDLVAEFDIPIGEDGHDYHILERREEFAEILLTFVKHVAASEYTDDEGHVRPETDLLDFMYTFSSVSAEKYRWSLHDTADILHRTRQLLDADDRMTDLADRSRQGEL